VQIRSVDPHLIVPHAAPVPPLQRSGGGKNADQEILIQTWTDRYRIGQTLCSSRRARPFQGIRWRWTFAVSGSATARENEVRARSGRPRRSV